MLEREFQRAVVDAARVLGWRVHYVADSRRSPVGWPDVTAVRRGRVLFLECKQQHGRIRPGQEDWVADLDAVPGATARIVRPSDWPWIEEQLKMEHP